MRLLPVIAAALLFAPPVAAQPPDAAVPEAHRAPHEAPPAEAFRPARGQAAFAQPAPERWSTGARLGSELGGGLLGMVTGGVTGGTLLGAVGLAGCGWSGIFSGWSCVGALAGGGVVLGSLAALPFGIEQGGHRAGGNGSAVAAAAGVSFSCLGAALTFKRAELAVPIALTAPLLGIAFYELSDNAPAGADVTPTLSLAPGSGSLGLQGHF